MLFRSTIDVWYAGERVQTMERLRGQSKHRIDYRHVIDWLVRKPGAFARYVYRADLYPTLTYRRVYDALLAQQPGRADREYVRILHLAAQDGEARVEQALVKLLGRPAGHLNHTGAARPMLRQNLVFERNSRISGQLFQRFYKSDTVDFLNKTDHIAVLIT